MKDLLLEVIASFIKDNKDKDAVLDMSNKDLSGADFSKISDTIAFWGNIDFSGSDLSNANFSGCRYLSCTNFTGANLKNANFKGAKVSGSDFIGANLEKASFKDATISCAVFRNANIKGVNFSGTYMFQTFFQEVDCKGVEFKVAKNAIEADFKRAINVDLSYCPKPKTLAEMQSESDASMARIKELHGENSPYYKALLSLNEGIEALMDSIKGVHSKVLTNKVMDKNPDANKSIIDTGIRLLGWPLNGRNRNLYIAQCKELSKACEKRLHETGDKAWQYAKSCADAYDLVEAKNFISQM